MESVNLSFLRIVRQTAHDLIHMFSLPSSCTTLDTLTAVSDGDVCHLIVKRTLEHIPLWIRRQTQSEIHGY
jgi:hypothetical protein